VREHVTILGALYIAFGLMGVIAGSIVFVAVAGGGLLSGDPDAIAITSAVGTATASLLFVLAIPAVIGGIALLKYVPWARYVILVLGCLNLPGIPVGTALGIYTIWVLIKPETAVLFSDGPPSTS